MANSIIDSTTEDGKRYPIQPSHINTEKHFAGAFGDSETEVSARDIVRCCQSKGGGWIPITRQELYLINRKHFWFRKLTSNHNENDYVIEGTDGLYRVTHEFICACFRSSPNL